MKWTEVWHGPFEYDHYGYIWDRDGVMTFTVDDLTEVSDKEMDELCASMVAALNGEEVKKKYEGLHIQDGCDLYQGDRLLGYFRGWGHLTGGLKLSQYEAAKVQDELIEAVLSKITVDGMVIIKLQKTEE